MSQASQNAQVVCARCIMHTAVDPAIEFDDSGVCNHCRRYDELLASRGYQGRASEELLISLVEEMKRAGSGLDYDCIIGVSGGVDSSYVASKARELGLRPLAVHFDNGWNSELAVKNIELLLKALSIDLHTEVIDWPEFRDIQRAFLLASTPDGEVPTDHAIQALLWREASRRGIRYILSGMNFATESIAVPSWSYGHSDWKYIRAVHKRFGSHRLRTFPKYSIPRLLYWNAFRRIRIISILNYMPFDKESAQRELESKYGWRRYGGKHYESIYTRFYQGYVLPKKFGIDKRIGHLSDLINSGQISRADAIEEAARPDYPDDLMAEDKAFVLKKLGFTESEFDRIMEAPAKTYRNFPNNEWVVRALKRVINMLRALGLYPK